MSKNDLIALHCFDREIGKIGFDENRNASFFQYNPAFLQEGIFTNMFPLVFKRIPQTQVFDKYNNDTFRGLPPMIADSLPDTFGNVIFRAWLESGKKALQQITALEQLAYVGQRGIGALEYFPSKNIPGNASINIDEIIEVVRQVLHQKQYSVAPVLNHASLLNIFKVGTSAGGARPKILVSENKETGAIVPGDIVYSADYNHYLVKLGIDAQEAYSREVMEYTYYLAAVSAGIDMMPSRLIDDRHFATLRFDRVGGQKKHVLTATGMTGWDFMDPKVSGYEKLFELAVYLKLPHRDIEQLYRRMIFNLVFANHDDHLKNHSFIYDEEADKWGLSPAYDLTYSLNPMLHYKHSSRALSVNGKRTGISLTDVLLIADLFTIKNPSGIIEEVQQACTVWPNCAKEYGIPENITATIASRFDKLK